MCVIDGAIGGVSPGRPIDLVGHFRVALPQRCKSFVDRRRVGLEPENARRAGRSLGRIIADLGKVDRRNRKAVRTGSASAKFCC